MLRFSPYRLFNGSVFSFVVCAAIIAQYCAIAFADDSKKNDSPPTPRRVILASHPSLSPDGATLAFSWDGDLWSVSSKGGAAKRLTSNSARDDYPRFSPNGKEIAFTSMRVDGNQIHIMPAEGGVPQQITYHTEGCALACWYPDGESLMTRAMRDHGWKQSERFFKIDAHKRSQEKILFDDYGDDGRISPDGNRLLYVREGAPWWRQGYVGSQDAQIWMYDLREKKHEKILNPAGGARWPEWRPDGKGFYFAGCGEGKTWNLCEYDFESKKTKQLTGFASDPVVQPTLAKDGKTLVFRHLFDLYRYEPNGNKTPEKLDITVADDNVSALVDRRNLTNASHVAFTHDGLEIAFVSGGDVWVMDTELREPRQVTDTADEERDLVFSNDGSALYFVSDKGGQTDIWRAERSDPKKYWWNTPSFKLEQITQDADVESALKFNFDGSRLAYLRGTSLWTMNANGSDAKQVVESWNDLEYDWSPDGKWFAYSMFDNDFNRDIWIAPSDGTGKPYNVSRHPDNDSSPVWSPDGKLLAYTGKRGAAENDIFYVWLRAADDETNRYDRTLQRALDKMQKGRPRPSKPMNKSDRENRSDVKENNSEQMQRNTTKQNELLSQMQSRLDAGNFHADSASEPEQQGQRRFRGNNSPNGPATEPANSPEKPAESVPAASPPAEAGPKKAPTVQIDFAELHERVHRISISNTNESNLFWSPDGKRLAFTATVEGRRGTYAVDFPDDIRPKLLTGAIGSQATWLATGNQIAWLSEGSPATVATVGPAAGNMTQYKFAAHQTLHRESRHVAVFDQCWRIMRDRFYDERLGNKNWDEVRRKYEPAAAIAPDLETLGVVVNLMLGELNGSHLGFSVRPDDMSNDPNAPLVPPNPPIATPNPMAAPQSEGSRRWTDMTAHLGVRFVADDHGPGLLIRDVLPTGPAEHVNSILESGERILSIDGTTVDPDFDLTTILNGRPDRDIELKVKSGEGKERSVTIRPISYAHARALMYEFWIKQSQAAVEKESQGKLGYLHISRMDDKSLVKFEEELFSVGAGKDGLIIDVRENPGGSICDHLLTMLSQPDHAITRPRGGGPGYPQDRIVFPTWRKPIIVLCNQNSFSNAEIFSHSIQVLKRGKLVGVPTAGGVISTGATRIMDVGVLRLPFRGWYDPNTGEDMELRGAVPEIVIWPEPGEMPSGKDRQLTAAVESLLEDVKTWKARPTPKLHKAMEREEFKGTK